MEHEDGVTMPSCSIVEGRLKYSEMLAVINNQLPHLNDGEKADIIALFQDFPELFGDVPTVTMILEHDIDVGMTKPKKQHPYRVNPMKHAMLWQEVEYMLSNNIAEPSSSPWSSLCIVVDKPASTY